MVENIEELCPELHVESFPDFGVLDQREIKRARAWTDELIATTVFRVCPERAQQNSPN